MKPPDTTIDTSALIDAYGKACLSGAVSVVDDSTLELGSLQAPREALRKAFRTLTADNERLGAEVKRLKSANEHWQSRLNARLLDVEALTTKLENYQEKARALHKYLGDKNIAGIEAVITEFSLMAEQEVSE